MRLLISYPYRKKHWKHQKNSGHFLNIADEDGTTLSDSQYFGRIATRSPEGGAEYKTNGCTLYTHSLGPYIKAAVTYKKSDDDVTITSSSVYTGSPYKHSMT